MYIYVTYVCKCITYIPEARGMCTLQNISTTLASQICIYTHAYIHMRHIYTHIYTCHICIHKYVKIYIFDVTKVYIYMYYIHT